MERGNSSMLEFFLYSWKVLALPIERIWGTRFGEIGEGETFFLFFRGSKKEFQWGKVRNLGNSGKKPYETFSVFWMCEILFRTKSYTHLKCVRLFMQDETVDIPNSEIPPRCISAVFMSGAVGVFFACAILLTFLWLVWNTRRHNAEFTILMTVVSVVKLCSSPLSGQQKKPWLLFLSTTNIL